MVGKLVPVNWRDYFIAVIIGGLMGLLVLAVTGLGLSNKIILVIFGGLTSLIVLLIVRDIRRLMVLAIFIDLSTAMDFHLTCNDHYFLSVCGVNVSLTVLALAILYVLWIKNIYRNQQGSYRRSPRLSAIGWLNVGFLMACLLSFIPARNISFSVYQLWLYLYLFGLFFYLANNITSQEDVIFVIVALALGFLLQNTLMEMQSVGLLPQSERTALLHRATGTLQSPNAAGGYLSQMVVIMFAVLGLKLVPRDRRILIVVIGLGVSNLIATESRGGWTSMLIGMSIVLVVSLGKRWFSYKALIAIFIGVCIFMVFFSGPIIDRLTRDDKGSADSRAPLAQIAFNMIQANPVLGVGLNNFGVVIYNYIGANEIGAWLNLVHNRWLLVWSETGTVGMFFFVSFWLLILYRGLYLVRRGHPIYGVLALGIIASMVGATFHMMAEIYRWRILLQIIWTNAALIVAMTRLQYQYDRLSGDTLKEARQQSRVMISLLPR